MDILVYCTCTYQSRSWTKSRNPVIPNVIHHYQNPLETTTFYPFVLSTLNKWNVWNENAATFQVGDWGPRSSHKYTRSIHGDTTQKIAVLINTNRRKLVTYLILTSVCACYTLQRNDYSANLTACFQDGCKHFSTPGDAMILHCNWIGWVAYKSGSMTKFILEYSS